MRVTFGLWEELTPIPNRRSLRIVDTYAGFTGDSPILEPMWARALAGERLDDELPIYGNGRLWAFIDRARRRRTNAWLGDPADREAYYEEQRATLAPGHVRASAHEPVAAGRGGVPVGCGLGCDRGGLRGAGARSRRCARTWAWMLRRSGTARLWSRSAGTRAGCLCVLAHRIWTPPKGGTLDLEATIERYVRELAWRFGAVQVSFDPSQMIRSAQELRGAGVPMTELPQTSGNLTQASQALFDVVKERRLRCYPAADLRQHILNSVVVETPRGWRLAKEKASRKIDGAVALSFAVSAAVQGSRSTVGDDYRPQLGGHEAITAGLRAAQF